MRLANCLVFALLAVAFCINERDFRIELRKAEITELSTKFLSDKSHVSTVKLNDSVAMLDGKLVFAADFAKDTKIEVSGFQLSSSGEWVKSFSEGPDSLCGYWLYNIDVFENLFADYEFPDHCPPEKDYVLTFEHAVMEVGRYPKDLPEGQWKINSVVTTGSGTVVLDINIYADIVKTGV